MSETQPIHEADADRLEAGLSVMKSFERPNDDEIRVLIFTACYFVLDGVTLTIRRLESHFRSRGASVKILSTVPDDYEDDKIKEMIVVPGIKIPFTHAGTGYAFGSGLDEDIIREIERYKPNVCHFTIPDLVGLDGVKWCQKNNIPYIATWHSNYCDYLKYYFLEWIAKPGFLRYLQGFYEQMPVVLVPTPYIRDKMVKEGFGRFTELKLWGRGCDLDLFSPDRRSQEFRSSRDIGENDIVLLWVGRLVPEKRPEIWMDVVDRLQNEGMPVKGMVVGHGTFENSLSKMKDVICCGWLSGTALAEAYASADILLFPSDVETFGNVTLEALASGCPCIVEDKCGGHLVEDGYNGFTCPAADSDQFYKATKRLVQDELLRKRMSNNARSSAWKFERNNILQEMLEHYKDAYVRHRDPMYIKKRMASPEVAGKNVMSFLCCNYWLVKTFANPVLNATSSMQNLAYSTSECVSHSRSRCLLLDRTDSVADLATDSKSNRFDDEKKGREYTSAHVLFLIKMLNITAVLSSYILVFAFAYASFTV